MRAVIQRVKSASVSVDEKIIGKIGEGLLIYLGIAKNDTEAHLDYMVKKASNLRVFPGSANMDLSIKDVKGQALIVSQFTLCCDLVRGNRPSFSQSMEPQKAERLYLLFVKKMQEAQIPCQTGSFGAMMKVESINDGPLTFFLESKKNFE